MTDEERDIHFRVMSVLESTGWKHLSAAFWSGWAVEIVQELSHRAGLTDDHRLLIRRDSVGLDRVLSHEAAHFVRWVGEGSRKHDLRFCWLWARLWWVTRRTPA